MDLARAIAMYPGLLEKLGNLRTCPLPDTPILFAKMKLLWSCNLACSFCERPELSTMMSFELVEKILKQLRARGLKKIHFSGGEIFLHPQIFKILQAACEFGLQVNLTTNGTLLDRDKVAALSTLGVHSVSLSLDAATSSLHDRLRGRKGAFKATLKALKLLLKNGEKHPKVRVNTVVTRANIREMEELYALLRTQPVKVAWSIIPVDAQKKRHRLDPALAAHLIQVTREWELVDSMHFNSSQKECNLIAKGLYATDYYQQHLCYMPWLHLFVDPSGFVYPCCMTRGRIPALGNFSKQSLEEILGNESARHMKMNLSAGKPPAICHHCDDYLMENKTLAEIIHSHSWRYGVEKND